MAPDVIPAALYLLEIAGGGSAVLRLRLAKGVVDEAFADFDQLMQTRVGEADAFSPALIPGPRW